MKRAALTMTISLALAAFAAAGPEPISSSSGKEMKQVAPTPPACPNWTGFYIGGFGGYKFGNVDTNLDLGGDWDNRPPDRDPIETRGSDDLDASGAELGGLFGYNYQLPNKWVIGVEAEGGYLWLRDSEVASVFGPVAGGDYGITSSFKTHFLFTAAPRIGYAFCNWMPYVTGGVAVGDLDFFQGITGIGPNFTFFERGQTSETNVGWMAGGGLEYALTKHWRVRAQYQYIDLGSVDFDHHGGPPGQEVRGFTGRSEADLTEHNASVAIIFGF